MGFPQVAATNTSSETANATTHTVNLPAGIAAGDLLLVVFGVDGAPAVTFPGGWTKVGLGAGTSTNLFFGHKIADGGEGASISVTTDASERSAHQSYRINHWHGVTVPVFGALEANGTDTAADPPSVNPSTWGTENTLWIITVVSDADTTFSADPANYTNPLENDSGSTTAGVKVRTLRRELAAASEDPDAFTNTNREWHARTIGIRPAQLASVRRRAFRGGP